MLFSDIGYICDIVGWGWDFFKKVFVYFDYEIVLISDILGGLEVNELS